MVTRLGRGCVPVKAGAQSEMKGVVLGASGTGATVFKEPEQVGPATWCMLPATTSNAF